ncbi:GNAT family N-acetyltransferase [Paenibacillus kobensis]|uniref:GNAT family N-acetyltransferase n=1 Tax=Paenibacillus kobensis TaxID=59841 RepID=UPI000FDC25D2|nr:GNAT family N-acetyltransferase [Paenibacillus kobensis]
MTKLVIEEAAFEHWPIVHRIMREAFEEYRGVLNPPSGALRESMEDTVMKLKGRGGAVLAWLDGEPVGSAQFYREEEYMYIGRISVSVHARGRGIGKQIIAYLERLTVQRGAQETRLEVRLSIPDNIRLYERLGYSILEHVEYPEKTDSWYIMCKPATAG